jgi:hypothetical protein
VSWDVDVVDVVEDDVPLCEPDELLEAELPPPSVVVLLVFTGM